MMTGVMRTKILSCLLGGLLLAGACGDPGEAPTEEPNDQQTLSASEQRMTDLVAASGDYLLEEESARVTATMATEMPELAGGGVMEGEGRGAFDYSSKRGYFNVSMRIPQFGTMTMKSITDFPHLYMNMTDMLEAFGIPRPPEMKPWIRANFLTIGEQIGVDMGALMQFGQSDMSSYALYTKGVVDVEELSEELVRGESATHYEATLDFEKLMEEDIPEDVSSSFEVLVDLMGTSRIPFEVWLDDQDRMVRQRMEIPMPAGATGETVQTTMDMTYYGFGSKVDVDLPPKSQTMGFEELLELTPGAGGETSDIESG